VRPVAASLRQVGPRPTFSSYNRANMNWDEVMEGFLADLPPTLEQRRRILEPLTERQLAQSFRQVRLDRHDHVIAKHSKTAYPLPWHAVGVMKRLAAEPTAHDRRPMFISVLSNAVSEYWSHLPRTTSDGSWTRPTLVADGLSHHLGVSHIRHPARVGPGSPIYGCTMEGARRVA